MPNSTTSGATETASSVRNALVAPYIADRGHGVSMAGEEVKTTQPRSLSLRMRWMKWWESTAPLVALQRRLRSCTGMGEPSNRPVWM